MFPCIRPLQIPYPYSVIDLVSKKCNDVLQEIKPSTSVLSILHYNMQEDMMGNYDTIPFKYVQNFKYVNGQSVHDSVSLYKTYTFPTSTVSFQQ